MLTMIPEGAIKSCVGDQRKLNFQIWRERVMNLYISIFEITLYTVYASL